MMCKKGFTLVELLVVISISAMLLAFIMPSLDKIRENAKTVVCSSNIKQLVICLQLYENENACFPPSFYRNIFTQPPGGFLGLHNIDKRGWWWQNYLESYLDDVSKFKCPSKNISDFRLKNNILCSNYGVNNYSNRSQGMNMDYGPNNEGKG